DLQPGKLRAGGSVGIVQWCAPPTSNQHVPLPQSASVLHVSWTVAASLPCGKPTRSPPSSTDTASGVGGLPSDLGASRWLPPDPPRCPPERPPPAPPPLPAAPATSPSSPPPDPPRPLRTVAVHATSDSVNDDAKTDGQPAAHRLLAGNTIATTERIRPGSA